MNRVSFLKQVDTLRLRGAILGMGMVLLMFGGQAQALAPDPLVFTGVAGDAVTQQYYWDELLKYKLWGKDFLSFSGQDVQLTERAGYTGTMGNFSMANTNHTVRGVVVIGGNISNGDGQDIFDSGYVRVGGNIQVSSNGRNNTYFRDYTCVHGSVENNYGVFTYPWIQGPNCPANFPALETDLDLPVLSVPYGAQTHTQNGGTLVIDGRPDPGQNVKDLYFDQINLQNGANLLIRQSADSGLTRIFVRDLSLDATGWNIGVTHNGSSMILPADYRGTLLIYTESMNVAAGTRTLMGTYISHGPIAVQQGLTLAGQLIGRSITVNAGFNAANFRYVPFDPPVLDPTALASGVFYEAGPNPQTVDIRLDRAAVIDVTFQYYYLTPGGVGWAEPADLINLTQVSEATSGFVTIPRGSTTPVTPEQLSIFDDILQEGLENFQIVIWDLKGAVLPNNRFRDTITLSILDNDNNIIPTSRDTSFTIDEDALLSLSATSFTFIDAAPGPTTMTQWMVTQLPGQGTLFLDNNSDGLVDVGEALSVNSVVSVADLVRLRFRPVANAFGNPYATFRFRVSDGEAWSTGFNTVTIIVSPVNDAPTDIALSSATIAENAGAHAVVGSLSTTDLDAGNTFTYTLVAGAGSTDNALFNISGNSLRVTSSLDFETGATRTVRIRSTDQGGLWVEKSFVITVTDVNETPTDLTLSGNTIAENQAVGTAIGTLATVDPDGGNTFTYSFVTGTGSDDNASFTLDGNTVRSNAVFDFEVKQTYSIRVRTTDQGGLFIERVFTITILNVNEVPIIDGVADTVVYATLTSGWQIVAVDVDGDLLTYTVLAGSPAGVSIDASGRVSWIPTQVQADASYPITIRVSDGALFADITWNVTVLPYNTAPIITAIADTAIAEKALWTRQVVVSDEQGGALVYSVAGPVGLVISESGVLSWTPDNADVGTHGVTVVVRDVGPGPALADTISFNITVINVNDPPVIGAIANQTTLEDALYSFTIPATDIDVGDVLAYSLVNPPTGMTVNATTGRITWIPDNEQVGVHQIQVVVRDIAGVQASRSYALQVINVNDLPVITTTRLSIEENSTAGTVVGAIEAADPDAFHTPQTLVYSIVSGNEAGQFNINSATGVVTVAPGASIDFESVASYSLRVAVSDGEGQSEATVTVVVVDVNEPPAVQTDSLRVSETARGGDVVGRVVATDPDGDLLNYEIIGETPFVIAVDGTVRVATGATLDYETDPEYVVAVRVSDGKGEEVTAEVTVRITNVLEYSLVEIVEASTVDSVWARPDTVRTNVGSIQVVWTEDGTRRTSTEALREGVNIIIKTYQDPTKDFAGADTLVVLVNTTTPAITLDLPVVRPTPRPHTAVEPLDPNEPDVFYINDRERMINGSVTYINGLLQSQTDRVNWRPTLVEGLNELIYAFTDPYGNIAYDTVRIVLDTDPPVVRIVAPEDSSSTELYVIPVQWTVDGTLMDTLNLQSLQEGWNQVVRSYRDRAGNVGSDTVWVELTSKRRDVKVALEEPLLIMDRNRIEHFYSITPPVDGEVFSLSVFNPALGREERLQYGAGGNIREADGAEPYPGFAGKHLGPTLRVEVKLPQMGGIDAAGNARGGSIGDLVEADGRIALTAGSGAERHTVTVAEYMSSYCMDDAFEGKNPSDLHNLSLYKARILIDVGIYDAIGQFVDRLKVTQEISDAQYLNDAGVAVMFLELKPDRQTGLRTQSGRTYGSGAFIVKGFVRSSAVLQCDTPDLNKGSRQVFNESILEKFGYRRN